MKKLVSSSEAAQILGLSLQGIHYRIKKGQLESLKKDGKIFVYVDSSDAKKKTSQVSQNNATDTLNSLNELALKSKDEQIILLKKTIKYVKKQHDKELERLDNTQTKMIDVFKSEVDLLKSAFSEMKNIYAIEKKPVVATVEKVKEEKIESVYKKHIEIKDFYLLLKKNNISDKKIKDIILEKVKSSDKRFSYKKETKEILILNSDFLDIL